MILRESHLPGIYLGMYIRTLKSTMIILRSVRLLFLSLVPHIEIRKCDDQFGNCEVSEVSYAAKA